MRWLSDPEVITHGVWGPLHYYLISASLALVPDLLYSPVAVHVGFGLVAPCLIYLFTKEEFGSSRSALLIAALYALYPVAIRNSVSVPSETIFIVFVLASMLLLSIARSERGRPMHAERRAALVDRHGEGVLVLLDGSRFSDWIGPWQAGEVGVDGLRLALQPLHSVDWPANAGDAGDSSLEIFRYRAERR